MCVGLDLMPQPEVRECLRWWAVAVALVEPARVVRCEPVVLCWAIPPLPPPPFVFAWCVYGAPSVCVCWSRVGAWCCASLFVLLVYVVVANVDCVLVVR